MYCIAIHNIIISEQYMNIGYVLYVLYVLFVLLVFCVVSGFHALYVLDVMSIRIYIYIYLLHVLHVLQYMYYVYDYFHSMYTCIYTPEQWKPNTLKMYLSLYIFPKIRQELPGNNVSVS